jgi:hypothetical protein
LTLTSRGFEIVAYVRDAGALVARDLIGTEIRLRGVVEPGTATSGPVPGARLVAATATDVEIVRRVNHNRSCPSHEAR